MINLVHCPNHFSATGTFSKRQKRHHIDVTPTRLKKVLFTDCIF